MFLKLLLSTESHIVIVIRTMFYRIPEYQQNFKTWCDKLVKEGKLRKIAEESFPGYLSDVEGLVLHYQKIH